jgi:hypothetical protein
MSETEYVYHEEKKGVPGWLKGCLVLLVVMVLGVGLVIWWVSRNFVNIAMSFGAPAVEQAIDQLEFPEAEKAEMKQQVQRMVQLAKDGKINAENFGKMIEKLVESPLMSSFVLLVIEKQYFEKSGLTDEEKEQGRTAIRRVVQGAVDEKITQQQLNDLIATISEPTGGGEQELKQQLTDEELRAFLAAAQQLADDAGVAAEVPEVDPSDELKRIIDEAVGELPEATASGQ